jgi:hypothetical protein
MQKTKTKISKASIFQFESFFHVHFLSESVSSSYTDKVKLPRISKIFKNSPINSVEVIHFNSAPSIIPVKFYDKDIKAKYLETNTGSINNIDEDISADQKINVVYSKNKDLSKALGLDKQKVSHVNHFTQLYNYLRGVVDNSDGLSFFIKISSGSFEIMIFNKKEFVFFNTYEIVDENEFLYYTFFVLKNFQSSIKKDKIIFIGKHEMFDNYYNLASKYSRIDFIEDDTHSILNFEENFFSVINANNIRD